MKFFSKLAILAVTLAAATPAVHAETDYNLVGKVSAIMLRNLHFNKQSFDEKLSQRLLARYLSSLDFQKVYFLKDDVDAFHRKYGNNLHIQLLDANCMQPAKEIYTLYLRRVEARHAWLNKRLDDNHYTFDTDQVVTISRKDAAWPVDAAEADTIWNRRLEDSLLREKLRILDAEKKAAEAKDKKAEDGTPEADTKKKEEKDPLDLIRLRYKRVLENLRNTNDEEICDYFLSALTAVYGPHTEYFSHAEEVQFQTSMRNSLTGIGALLEADDDGTTQIKGIVVKGPADREGSLHLDDRIVGVDSRNSGEMTDIMYMKINKVVELIRGPENTEVRLKVVPASDPSSSTEIIILREKVELKDQLATAQLIRRHNESGRPVVIGWIDVPSFYADFNSGNTGLTRDVKKLLARLEKENIEGLVLDLRGNGGGSLDEAVDLTGLFIKSGPVVQVKDSFGNIKVLKSSPHKALYEGPLLVITDKTSASASEIFAAALQDYHRAVIVGEESTFGKGTVQTIAPVGRAMPLFADSDRAGSLKVTIQKFYRIAGGSTQLHGVKPGIIIPSRIDALKIGEASLDNPLPYDTIPAQNYEVADLESLHVPELKKLSEQRVASSVEYKWICEDIKRMKEQVELNTLSLNLKKRQQEQKDNKERIKSHNAERRARFAAMEKAEAPHTQIFKLTLDNLHDEQLQAQSEFGRDDNSSMRRSEDEDSAAAEKPPEYPFGFDPLKRESLAIIGDLIEITSKAAPKTVQAEN